MIQETVESLTQLLTQLVLTAHYPAARANLWTMVTKSVSGALATGAQASSLAITRRRDNTATGTVALQSYPVALTSSLIFFATFPGFPALTLQSIEFPGLNTFCEENYYV